MNTMFCSKLNVTTTNADCQCYFSFRQTIAALNYYKTTHRGKLKQVAVLFLILPRVLVPHTQKKKSIPQNKRFIERLHLVWYCLVYLGNINTCLGYGRNSETLGLGLCYFLCHNKFFCHWNCLHNLFLTVWKNHFYFHNFFQRFQHLMVFISRWHHKNKETLQRKKKS